MGFVMLIDYLVKMVQMLPEKGGMCCSRERTARRGGFRFANFLHPFSRPLFNVDTSVNDKLTEF
jgi:hypothetical protein